MGFPTAPQTMPAPLQAAQKNPGAETEPIPILIYGCRGSCIRPYPRTIISLALSFIQHAQSMLRQMHNYLLAGSVADGMH